MSHESSLTTLGTICPGRHSQAPNARRARSVLRVIPLLRIRKYATLVHPFTTSVNMTTR
jgi:hypothetical protein